MSTNHEKTPASTNTDNESDMAIRVVNLHKSFGNLSVLKGINFTVRKGEMVCIIGASGSGKSTLLRCINFLEIPNSGRIYLHGELMGFVEKSGGQLIKARNETICRMRESIGFVFQLFNLWPHRTVLGNILEAPMTVKKMSRRQAEALGFEMLCKVGLEDKRDEYPSSLSGGQQQRVAIARALAMQPSILLFDEPTSALDPELVGEVIAVLKKLAEEGHTMLMATHEMGFARDTADHVIFIDEGEIEEEGSPGTLFTAPQSARTREFLERILSK